MITEKLQREMDEKIQKMKEEMELTKLQMEIKFQKAIEEEVAKAKAEMR